MPLIDAVIETTTSFIQNIVLALITYPQCQKKAQEEMDRVVGATRIPTLADYDNLPYLRAFVEEVFPRCFSRSCCCMLIPRNPASEIPHADAIIAAAYGYRGCVGLSFLVSFTEIWSYLRGIQSSTMAVWSRKVP